MDFLTLAKKRYSSRKYSTKSVEPQKLDYILEAGRVAPTAKNLQPHKILVIQEPKGLEKLAKSARTYSAPVALLVCADHTQAWVRPFDGKDHGDVDVSIVTDHMMLAATEQGLNTVWVCYFDPEIIREEFAIPETLEPVNVLLLGYAEDSPKPIDRHDEMRKPLSETVFYEKF
jgi:nitroreductase